MINYQQMERAIESACKRLGYSKLKEEQLRSVVDVLSGRDAFVSFPTGYGKSLCYAILPWAFDEVRKHCDSCFAACEFDYGSG